MGRGTGVRLRTWLALLAVFVGGAALWAYGASWAFVRVAGFLAEGPFGISIDNRSGEAVVVTTQVGATGSTRHLLAVDASAGAGWGSCAVTDVVVELRGVPDQVVSRGRLEVCDGDVVVVGEDLEVVVE